MNTNDQATFLLREIALSLYTIGGALVRADSLRDKLVQYRRYLDARLKGENDNVAGPPPLQS